MQSIYTNYIAEARLNVVIGSHVVTPATLLHLINHRVFIIVSIITITIIKQNNQQETSGWYKAN